MAASEAAFESRDVSARSGRRTSGRRTLTGPSTTPPPVSRGTVQQVLIPCGAKVSRHALQRGSPGASLVTTRRCSSTARERGGVVDPSGMSSWELPKGPTEPAEPRAGTPWRSGEIAQIARGRWCSTRAATSVRITRNGSPRAIFSRITRRSRSRRSRPDSVPSTNRRSFRSRWRRTSVSAADSASASRSTVSRSRSAETCFACFWRGASTARAAALGAGAAALSVLAPLQKHAKQVSAERERLTVERDALAESAAETDVLLQRERKDRRFVEGTLSGRDLLERDRRVILERHARGEPLRVILTDVAALVEQQGPPALCAISPRRQAVRARGSAGSVGPFGSSQEDIPLGSTTPPLSRAVEEHRLVVTSDAPGDPLWSACRETFAPHGIKTCWTIPIETGGGVVLGTVSVLLPEVRRPERADTSLLSNAASLAAIAIEQRQFAEQLLFQARFDSLTSLPNRLSLEESLRSAVSRAAGSGARVTLAYIDLDRFKQVNDTFGHAGGDELLHEVAFRLSGALADGDVLARMGGDEFCVLRVETPGTASQCGQLPERHFMEQFV